MAYYYVNGVKQPVDEHSTPEEKQAAYEQEQQDLAASRGDASTNGDPNGVKPPDNSGQPTTTGVGGSIVETLNPTITPAELAREQADAKARAAAAAAAAADEQYKAHYQYGGWAGGAHEAASRYAGIGAAAQGRQGEQLALGAVDQDRTANQAARGSSLGMADMLAGRANGSQPLISGMRANQDINRALADQSSIAASARGPAALALAQQQQANQSSAAMGNISNSAQINSAQEQLNNTVAAGNAYNTIRGGDQSLMGADTSVSVAQAQINAAQREANDRMQLGMTGYETGVQGAQLQAQGNQIAGERGAYATQQGIDLAHDQNSTAKTTPYIAAGLGAAGATAAAVVASKLIPGTGGQPAPTTGNGTPGTGDTGPGTDAGASSADPSGSYGAGASVSDPYDPNKPPGTSAGTSDDRAKEPASLGMSQMLAPRSDSRTPMATALSTMHDETKGPASSSVSMARMLAARDAQAEQKAKAEKWGAIAGNAVGGLGRAFAQPAPVARIDTTQPMQHPISTQPLSDDKTKLAAAWDQGRAAGIEAAPHIALRAQHAAAAHAMDAGRPAMDARQAEARKAIDGFDDSASRYNTSENVREMYKAATAPSAPAAPQQPGPAIARMPAPSGSFDAQVRDQFGSPPPVVLQPTQASGEPDYFAPPPQRVATTSDAQAKTPLVTTSATRKATPGATEEGNINHYGRPSIDNHDGTTSTVRSMSFGDGPGREVLIPTAYDGAVHSGDESIAHYRQTGQHMGVFKTPESATAQALRVHDDYENGRYADVGSHVMEQRAPKTTTSDAACKLSMASMLGPRRDVGTLGKEVSREDTADFARSLRSTPYAYKPSFAAREGQKPGEVNVGPVAQEIEKSRIGATIVKPDAQGSGMRTLDETKMVKGLGGVAAAHQEHLDELDHRVSLMARMLGGRR